MYYNVPILTYRILHTLHISFTITERRFDTLQCWCKDSCGQSQPLHILSLGWRRGLPTKTSSNSDQTSESCCGGRLYHHNIHSYTLHHTSPFSHCTIKTFTHTYSITPHHSHTVSQHHTTPSKFNINPIFQPTLLLTHSGASKLDANISPKLISLS